MMVLQHTYSDRRHLNAESNQSNGTETLQPSPEMVEDVFAKWDSPEEGMTVRSLLFIL